jgi:hypothetical protein
MSSCIVCPDKEDGSPNDKTYGGLSFCYTHWLQYKDEYTGKAAWIAFLKNEEQNRRRQRIKEMDKLLSLDQIQEAIDSKVVE